MTMKRAVLDFKKFGHELSFIVLGSLIGFLTVLFPESLVDMMTLQINRTELIQE